MPTDNTPLRYRINDQIETRRPFGSDFRFGVYFPGTDLCINDMGGRGTGKPSGVVWLDGPDAVKTIPASFEVIRDERDDRDAG